MSYSYAADRAVYAAARDDFHNTREALQDQAQEAREASDHKESTRLLALARHMTFTGLYWRRDNGLERQYA
jgi:hypothetical protein